MEGLTLYIDMSVHQSMVEPQQSLHLMKYDKVLLNITISMLI